MSSAPTRPSGSCYAALEEVTLQAPVPVRPASSHQPPVMSPVRERTPCPSRAPLTAPLPTAHTQTYEYDNQIYHSADEVINATGQHHGIHNDLIKWMTDSIKAITTEGIVSMHNYVAEKINKAVGGLTNDIGEVQTNVENLEAQHKNEVKNLYQEIADLKEENRQLRNNMDQLHRNSLVQQQSLKTLENAFLALAGTHTQPVMGQPIIHPVSQSTPLGATSSLSTGLAPMPMYTQVPPAPPVAPQHAFLQPQVQGPRLKMPDPPKFSGSGTPKLRDWLLDVKLFCTTAPDNFTRLCIALSYLEGGAAAYMKIWCEAMAEGRMHGTWVQFEHEMNTMYCDTDPIQTARTNIGKVCNKKYNEMKDFAQDFRQQASETAYSDADLMERIKQKRPEAVANLQTSMELNGNMPPRTWPLYLQQVVEIDKKVHDEKAAAKTTQHHLTLTQSSKTHNAMDVDSMQKKPSKERVDLMSEQLAWHKDGKCILCGTHKWVYKEKCKTPLDKYKNKAFNVPRRQKATKIATIDSTPPAPLTTIATLAPAPPLPPAPAPINIPREDLYAALLQMLVPPAQVTPKDKPSQIEDFHKVL
jgi:hypothetical protein